jgi:hypothetical protein
MKRSILNILTIITILIIATSLSACGSNNANNANNATTQPPTNSGQTTVKVEVQTPQPTPAVSVGALADGTYRADHTLGMLGSEVTFNGNEITTRTGTGKYEIDDARLRIQYDYSFDSYTFEKKGDSIFLDDVEFVKANEAAEPTDKPAYDPYTPSEDEPYPDLIIGIIPSGNSRTPPKFAVDLEQFGQYVRHCLQWRANNGDNYAQSALDGEFRVERDFLSGPLIDDGATILFSAKNTWSGYQTEQYGVIITYSTSIIVYFGEKALIQGETQIYYSVSLGRIIDQEALSNISKTDIDSIFNSAAYPKDAKYGK